jgi:hypothetical protein
MAMLGESILESCLICVERKTCALSYKVKIKKEEFDQV